MPLAAAAVPALTDAALCDCSAIFELPTSVTCSGLQRGFFSMTVVKQDRPLNSSLMGFVLGMFQFQQELVDGPGLPVTPATQFVRQVYILARVPLNLSLGETDFNMRLHFRAHPCRGNLHLTRTASVNAHTVRYIPTSAASAAWRTWEVQLRLPRPPMARSCTISCPIL